MFPRDLPLVNKNLHSFALNIYIALFSTNVLILLALPHVAMAISPSLKWTRLVIPNASFKLIAIMNFVSDINTLLHSNYSERRKH